MATRSRPTDGSIENPSEIDSLEPVQSRHLSRSPHPYHRRSLNLPNGELNLGGVWAGHDENHGQKLTPKSSSDSGTEADDESGSLLKGLPAPPARPRKGLRDLRGNRADTDASPLVTPSFLNADQRRLCFQAVKKHAAGGRVKEETDGETRRIREKYTRRKWAEAVRRLSEMALLMAVGAIVCCGKDVLSAARQWRKELFCHLVLLSGLYSSYPLRLLAHLRKRRTPGTTSIWSRIRLPSNLDPAPLLYPIFLPLFVGLSLVPTNPTILLPNLILSLSSVIPQLIPSPCTYQSYQLVHWGLTTLPLLVSEHFVWKVASSKPLALKLGPSTLLNSEVLTLLYPVQQALLPTLEYLTTTSLLPAELRLLATALINLLLFSASPQSEILKALLWIGGIGILVSCRHVLQWEVALARVPSWRFRRSVSTPQSKSSLLKTLDDSLCSKFAFAGLARDGDQSSDSDDPSTAQVSGTHGPRHRHLKLDTNNIAVPHLTGTGFKPVSAVEKPNPVDSLAMNGIGAKDFQSIHKRRHTFSTFDEPFPSPQRVKTTPSGRIKRSMTTSAQSFLSLTAAQAQVRKWLYAFYVYTIIVLIILIPVRRYVGKHALNYHEPFGWALGYLLGNVQIFRLWVVKADLEHWICLPSRDEQENHPTCHLGWVEHLRQDTFGTANTRLIICAYCIGVLFVGMATVFRLSSIVEVDTRRKVFHGMMVALLLPTTFVDPTFAALALALILAIFLLLDIFRASQLPPISRPLTYFLAPYVDGRDHRGPVIVSHMFLLIGCAVPLWLSLAGIQRDGRYPWEGWDVVSRDISLVSGVVCVGMGDAAASLIGRRFGRRKWFWGGGKSLEGSFAFAAAVTLGLGLARAWLAAGGWVTFRREAWITVFAKSTVAAAGASFTETVLTGGNDNVIVPIVLWLLVRGLQI